MAEARYDAIGEGYARRRRSDPRLAARIEAALGDARRVLNVGAGTGSYEPRDRDVTAVEPSETMIAQRAPDAAACVRASAESLPFADATFDAAMAILTIHHWSDWRAGLREMRRVARRVVLLTFDAEAAHFWLTHDYVPALAALDRASMPRVADLRRAMEQDAPNRRRVTFHAEPVPVPHDCVDGFLGAYWRRPEVYLDASARRAMSSFALVDAREGLARLERELVDGAWARRYSHLRALDELDLGYRLLVWQLDDAAR
jgi:ubiquinone/menaquinone biosynthesis C-methylase UbiE